MITISGTGSGLDIDGIVTGLMDFEREPVRRLEARRERLDVELSAFAGTRSLMGELATAAATLGDASTIAPFAVESGDDSVLTATATGAAAPGRHDIEVLSLATAHRVATAGYGSDAESAGAGTWRFESGDDAFAITLDGDDSLRALRDAINDAADNESIVASLLEVDDGTRLVLTAREAGTDHTIEATRSAIGGVRPPGDDPGAERPFEDVVEARDARLRVDGMDVTRSTNSVSDVIEGITLELAGVGGTTLATRRDLESMNETMSAFVEKYNALRETLSGQSNGPLRGDRLPRDVESELRRAFSTDVELADGSRIAPVELGLRFDKYGALSIDSAELAARQAEGFESLVQAYARPDEGFAARLERILERYTRADGRIASREDGVRSRMDTLGDMIDRTEYRLEKIEARYRRQFGAMDQMVGALQGTSGLLSSRLGTQGG